MTDDTIGVAMRDELAIQYTADQAGVTIRELLETWIARRAARLPLLPGPPRIRSEVLAQRIADRTAAGEPTTEIALTYGIQPGHVCRVRDGHGTEDRSNRS